MRTVMKSILAFVLMLAMLCSLAPVSALAEESLPLEGKVAAAEPQTDEVESPAAVREDEDEVELPTACENEQESAAAPCLPLTGEGAQSAGGVDTAPTAPKTPSVEGVDLPQAANPGEESSAETASLIELPSTPPASADAEPTSPVEGRQDDEDEDVALLYTYSGTYAGLYWSLDTSTGVLTISGRGAWQSDYSNSATPWESYKSSIKTVNIGNRVESIGAYAFRNCTGLTSVTIPDSVTTIDRDAFNGCTGLTSVTIPDSVTTIKVWAFSGCTGLTSITIPDSVTSIGGCAFYGCSGLTSITIPNSVTSIGEWAFSGCTNLTNVIYYGTSTQWSSITIGSANTPLKNAAKQFTMLSGICGANVTWLLDIITGVLTISGTGPMTEYSKTNTAPWYEHREDIQTVVIESGVSTVGPSAFRDCENLTAVTIPAGVTAIGASAFYHCTGLTEATIPAGVTSLGANVFSGCTGLESVTIPNSVTTIGNYGFYNCTALTDITYKGTEEQWNVMTVGTNNEPLMNAPRQYCRHSWDEGTVTTAPTCAAEGVKTYTCTVCGTTRTDAVPTVDHVWNSGVVTVEPGLEPGLRVYTCTNCGDTYAEEIPPILYGDGSTWVLDIITGVLTISGEGPMTEYSKGTPAPWYEYRETVRTVVIESGVTTVGASAFRDCENLTSVTVPDGVTAIGTSAFYHCTGLTEATIPAGVTSLGANVFSGCTGLESVTIPNSVTTIGNYGFYNCTGLTTVTYGGTEEQWNVMTVGTNNEPLTNALRQYCRHSWDEGVVTTSPTCAVEGVKTYTCTVCGTTRTDAVPTVDHTWGDGVLTRTTDGWAMVYTCTVCGETRSETAAVPMVAVGNEKALRGSKVYVPIRLEDNSGIAGAYFRLEFDRTALTLTEIVRGDGLSSLSFTPPGNLNAEVIRLMWDGQDADETNGILVTLVFTAKNDIELGQYPITLTYADGDVYGQNLENLTIGIINGRVTVLEYLPGDVDGDGSVTPKDVTLLRRYLAGGYGVTVYERAADVNRDGTLNPKDVTILRRYIVGGYGVTLD